MKSRKAPRTSREKWNETMSTCQKSETCVNFDSSEHPTNGCMDAEAHDADGYDCYRQKSEQDTWTKVMAHRKDDKRHQSRPNEAANNLRDDEVATLLATAEFFGADRRDLQQMHFDLTFARYRVFDWLAMCVMGRIDATAATKVFVHSFLKSEGDVDKFIADLRETDYQMDESWTGVEL